MAFRIIPLAVVLAALPALAFAAEPSERYALNLSVVRDGVEVVAARTLIVEDGTAEISVSDGDQFYQVNAELSPVQGDGDDTTLALYASISHADDQPQEPRLLIKRGGTARFETGREDASGAMTDGLKLTLTPVADAAH